MMQKNPLAERSGWIACRASTTERQLADALQAKLGVKSQSELLRYLLNSKAEAMGIG